MSGELSQADKDAMLIAQAAAFGALRPDVWETFFDGYIANVQREISERWPADPSTGSEGENSGRLAGQPPAGAGSS